MSLKNNNPFNIRRTPINWKGEKEGASAFEEFETMELGIRAGFKNILAKWKRGINTVGGLLEVLSPAHENPLESYISYVSKRCHVDPQEPLDLTNRALLFELGCAIMYFECGREIPPAQAREGLRLALES